MTIQKSENLQDRLAELDRTFVEAERSGETDDQLAAAVLDWILERERVRYQVVGDSKATFRVDQQTIQKMRDWDSDDPNLFSVEKILRRLAHGRSKDAMSLVRSLQEKGRLRSEEMRRRASAPRKSHPVDDLIEQIVRRQPTISQKLLLRKLELEAGGDVIANITDGEAIEPHDPDYSPLKVSGLKNRLSRIKKKISQ